MKTQVDAPTVIELSTQLKKFIALYTKVPNNELTWYGYDDGSIVLLVKGREVSYIESNYYKQGD